MDPKNLADVGNLPISTLRKGFAGYCKLLGLDKHTCFALTLLLNSKELLIAMMKFMSQIDQTGIKEGVSEDMTTIMVNVAVQLKDAADKKSIQ